MKHKKHKQTNNTIPQITPASKRHKEKQCNNYTVKKKNNKYQRRKDGVGKKSRGEGCGRRKIKREITRESAKTTKSNIQQNQNAIDTHHNEHAV